MRIVFIGAGQLTLATAPILIARRHDVVIIESDRDKIDAISEELDCGFIHGDGTKPAILREAGPKEADLLFCLTDNDQNNILASLVGRSLGFERVVTRISSTEYQQICAELGLSDTIIPDQTIARTLADMVEGREALELSTYVKGDARFFSYRVREGAEGAVEALELPAQTRVVCVYRGDEFILPQPGTTLRAKDEVVLITHRTHLGELDERYGEAAAKEREVAAENAADQ
ncbi:MAG TPA: NAD-binding protein [bacterium]|nr:NAD-binding protein [bacterium]